MNVFAPQDHQMVFGFDTSCIPRYRLVHFSLLLWRDGVMLASSLQILLRLACQPVEINHSCLDNSHLCHCLLFFRLFLCCQCRHVQTLEADLQIKFHDTDLMGFPPTKTNITGHLVWKAGSERVNYKQKMYLRFKGNISKYSWHKGL